MKIIRHGNRETKTIGTECVGCGCRFECDREEATMITDSRDGDFYSIDCPECKRLCTIAYKLTV